jgi:hypothetical protein
MVKPCYGLDLHCGSSFKFKGKCSIKYIIIISYSILLFLARLRLARHHRSSKTALVYLTFHGSSAQRLSFIISFLLVSPSSCTS